MPEYKGTGMQGAIKYANDRLQMRSLTGPKAPDKPADPIIVHKFCVANAEHPQLGSFVAQLNGLNQQWGEVTTRIGMAAMKNPDEVGAASVDYLMYSGYITRLKASRASLAPTCSVSFAKPAYAANL